MILVIGGIKGGSGKTTLATNLTVLRSQSSRRILLIDADEQRSASDWADQRLALGVDTPWTTIQLSGKSIHTEILKLAKNYDDVLIDTGGRDNSSQRSALTVADAFLVPFRPKSLDVWTMGKVNQLITEVSSINPKLRCCAVINQADSTGSDNKDAHEALSECPDLKCFPVFLGYRKAFSSAAAKGLGVTELKPIDKKAVQEMIALSDMIYS
jgi:chromosome partitioning protein